jgi:hypothetical protein
MLANISITVTGAGKLGNDVHLPAASRYELINFIADELPRWRDRSDRKQETSETVLTSQLCAHLNSASRHSVGWDILQFRIEEPDEQHKGRKIDLIPAPCGVTIWIEGRSHTDFDALLPIECKRLPIPKGKDRDEWEYVINRNASTGGIQRFKAGHHGAAYTLGAMIAYVQEETAAIWYDRTTAWINELVRTGVSGWSVKDQLHLTDEVSLAGLTVLRSSHTRGKDLPEIELCHLWLKMS